MNAAERMKAQVQAKLAANLATKEKNEIKEPKQTNDLTVKKEQKQIKEKEKEKEKENIKDTLVPDSFHIFRSEQDQIFTLQARLMSGGQRATKNSVVRAAIALLASSTDAQLLKVHKKIPAVKAGRKPLSKGDKNEKI